MKYANNPQAFINGFYSSSRNVFLTVSVAIAMYGFSNSFKNSREHIVKDISLLIILFSLMLGSINITYFNRFLTNLENEQKRGDILPNYIDLQMLRMQSYLKICFLIILAVLLITGIIRFINRRFN